MLRRGERPGRSASPPTRGSPGSSRARGATRRSPRRRRASRSASPPSSTTSAGRTRTSRRCSTTTGGRAASSPTRARSTSRSGAAPRGGCSRSAATPRCWCRCTGPRSTSGSTRTRTRRRSPRRSATTSRASARCRRRWPPGSTPPRSTATGGCCWRSTGFSLALCHGRATTLEELGAPIAVAPAPEGGTGRAARDDHAVPPGTATERWTVAPWPFARRAGGRRLRGAPPRGALRGRRRRAGGARGGAVGAAALGAQRQVDADALEDAARRARIDAVLRLVGAGVALVGERERRAPRARSRSGTRRRRAASSARSWRKPVIPPVSGSARSLHGSAITTGSGSTCGCTIAWNDRQRERGGRDRAGDGERARAPREHRDGAEQGERAGDQEGGRERVVDRPDEHVVGALGQLRELRPVLGVVGEAVRLALERALEPVARRRSGRGRRRAGPPSRSCRAAGAARRAPARAPCSRTSPTVASSWPAAIGARISSAIVMPAWRNESSRAACPGVRSGSSSPASAGSAMPMPAPARICGRMIQATCASGSHASASTPPPTSAQPALARGRRGAADPLAGDRRHREHRDRERGRERLERPAGDEQQHEQEQHAGERGRERARARPTPRTAEDDGGVRARGARLLLAGDLRLGGGGRLAGPERASAAGVRGAVAAGAVSVPAATRGRPRGAGPPPRPRPPPPRGARPGPGTRRSRASRTPASARRRAPGRPRCRRRRRRSTAARRRRSSAKPPTSAAAAPSACSVRKTSIGVSVSAAAQNPPATAKTAKPTAPSAGSRHGAARERRERQARAPARACRRRSPRRRPRRSCRGRSAARAARA